MRSTEGKAGLPGLDELHTHVAQCIRLAEPARTVTSRLFLLEWPIGHTLVELLGKTQARWTGNCHRDLTISGKVRAPCRESAVPTLVTDRRRALDAQDPELS